MKSVPAVAKARHLLALVGLAFAASVGSLSAADHYYVNDHLATTTAMTDAAGEISAIEADAFGTPVAGATQAARFTGKPYDDDIGAYVFPCRNYRSDEARWMSADPSGFPDGQNASHYAPIPTSKIDPFGLSASDVTLYTYGTEVGIVQWMLLAENKNPASSSYNDGIASSSMAAMTAVVYNRLSSPAKFGAPGAASVIDIITAPGQFAGFAKNANGEVAVSASINKLVNALYETAIAGTPGRYSQFINTAASIAGGSGSDPFGGITEINGIAVLGGAYGWRTQGSSSPGGSFIAIPSSMGGVIGGNQFYTLRE